MDNTLRKVFVIRDSMIPAPTPDNAGFHAFVNAWNTDLVKEINGIKERIDEDKIIGKEVLMRVEDLIRPCISKLKMDNGVISTETSLVLGKIIKDLNMLENGLKEEFMKDLENDGSEEEAAFSNCIDGIKNLKELLKVLVSQDESAIQQHFQTTGASLPQSSGAGDSSNAENGVVVVTAMQPTFHETLKRVQLQELVQYAGDVFQHFNTTMKSFQESDSFKKAFPDKQKKRAFHDDMKDLNGVDLEPAEILQQLEKMVSIYNTIFDCNDIRTKEKIELFQPICKNVTLVIAKLNQANFKSKSLVVFLGKMQSIILQWESELKEQQAAETTGGKASDSNGAMASSTNKSNAKKPPKNRVLVPAPRADDDEKKAENTQIDLTRAALSNDGQPNGNGEKKADQDTKTPTVDEPKVATSSNDDQPDGNGETNADQDDKAPTIDEPKVATSSNQDEKAPNADEPKVATPSNQDEKAPTIDELKVATPSNQDEKAPNADDLKVATPLNDGQQDGNDSFDWDSDFGVEIEKEGDTQLNTQDVKWDSQLILPNDNLATQASDSKPVPPNDPSAIQASDSQPVPPNDPSATKASDSQSIPPNDPSATQASDSQAILPEATAQEKPQSGKGSQKKRARHDSTENLIELRWSPRLQTQKKSNVNRK